MPHSDKRIAQKKAACERYREEFKDLPVIANPINKLKHEMNYWLSCLLIDKDALESTSRSDKRYTYILAKERI